jgi:hypothetical protein
MVIEGLARAEDSYRHIGYERSEAMRLGRRVGQGMVIVAAAAALAAVSASPAFATTSSRCEVSSSLVTNCKTGVVHANFTTHKLYYQACAPLNHFADWQVKDQNTGVIVAQGRVPNGGCSNNEIPGLLGEYWGWVFNTRVNATMYIDNR